MGGQYSRSLASTILIVSYSLLVNPVHGVPIPNLGGGGGATQSPTPTPSTSPSATPSPMPTSSPMVTQSPIPNKSASPSPSPMSSGIITPTPIPSSSSPTPQPSASSSSRPLLKPVAPLKASMQVQVPQKFSSLPPLLLAVPKSWQAKDQKNRISTQSWCKSPKEILSSTYVGGDCNTSQIPLALVSSKNQVEVQSLAFVPTRIAITSLKKSSQATIEVVNSKGKRLTLGKASTDSTGRLLLPPLTLGKTGIAVTVRILISGARTYEFVLRTIK